MATLLLWTRLGSTRDKGAWLGILLLLLLLLLHGLIVSSTGGSILECWMLPGTMLIGGAMVVQHLFDELVNEALVNGRERANLCPPERQLLPLPPLTTMPSKLWDVKSNGC